MTVTSIPFYWEKKTFLKVSPADCCLQQKWLYLVSVATREAG